MTGNPQLVAVELVRILISECDGDHRIVLKEKEGERSLSIAIGPYEALSIHSAVSDEHPPRPMTHDLMVEVMGQMGGKLHEVVIDRFVISEDSLGGTYHGKLICSGVQGGVIIDCRPSDAIALAVRLKVPIRVAAGVFVGQSGNTI